MNAPRRGDLQWPLLPIGRHSPKPRTPWLVLAIDLLVSLALVKAMTR